MLDRLFLGSWRIVLIKNCFTVVLKRWKRSNGAMFMLPIQRLKPQIDAVRKIRCRVLLGANEFPDQGAQDDLADVVTSIEYYLEAILEGRPDLELSLSAGEKAAQNLDKISQDYAEVDAQAEKKIEEESSVEEPEPAVEEAPVQEAAAEKLLNQAAIPALHRKLVKKRNNAITFWAMMLIQKF